MYQRQFIDVSIYWHRKGAGEGNETLSTNGHVTEAPLSDDSKRSMTQISSAFPTEHSDNLDQPHFPI